MIEGKQQKANPPVFGEPFLMMRKTVYESALKEAGLKQVIKIKSQI